MDSFTFSSSTIRAVLLLPTFNSTLTPCPVDAAAFEAHPQGHFCGHCQRVVQDFSQSQHPAADLAAARAASADGRVCGRFGAAQVLAPLPFTRRLRWFVVALVLVLGQGLIAREALAQVRRRLSRRPAHQSIPSPGQRTPATLPSLTDENPNIVYGNVSEKMPSFRGGGMREVVAYVQQQVRWPREAGRICVEGRIYASFTVDSTGKVRDARIVKSLQSYFDAEVLRVIRTLTGFEAGQQNGKPVAVTLTVPVLFKIQ